MTEERNERVIRDAEFAKRLRQSINEHPHAPDSHGQQVWLKRELEAKGHKMTKEAVRKWFAGEAKPRPKVVKSKAALLNVDLAWLSLGVAPDLAPKERRLRDATADGAVNLVAGLIQMSGGHPAFPEDDKAPADLFAIIKGAQYAFKVLLAIEEGEGMLKFKTPTQSEGLTLLGVVKTGPLSYDLLLLDPEMIERHGNVYGPITEVDMLHARGRYTTDGETWAKVKTFEERL